MLVFTMFDVVSHVLHTEIEASRKTAKITGAPLFSAFECVHEPRIDIRHFLRAFITTVESVEWVVALALVNRLLRKTGFSLSIHNVHRLMFTALLVAIKQLRGKDKEKLNETLGRVIQMDSAEVGGMERAFLSLIEWEVHVKLEEYAEAEKHSFHMLMETFMRPS